MKSILILAYLDPSCLPCCIKNPAKKTKDCVFLRLFFCLESSFVYIGMEPALSKNGWILKKFEVTCPARNESHTPIGSMYMVYLLTFSININPGPDVGKYTFLVPWICNGLHFLQPRVLFISFFFIVTGDQPLPRWPSSSNEEIMTGQPAPFNHRENGGGAP